MSDRIFLSASVPDPTRHRRFFDTADVIAIRDAVRALATVALPQSLLVWGGHPAITPLIRLVADSLGVQVQEHVWLYQSEFFREIAPSDNDAFAHVVWTEAVDGSRDLSLARMRQEMLRGPFRAGVFIGGMEGVLDEFEMFRQGHPEARLLPVASTGAAAREIYDENPGRYPQDLLREYAYVALFRRLLEIPEPS